MRKLRRALRPLFDIDTLLVLQRARFGGARMEDGGGDGAAGDAAGGGAQGGAGTTDAAAGAAAAGDAGKADDQNAAAADAQKIEDLPDWAQKIIRDTRKEAGDNRVAKTRAEQDAEARQQELVRALAKAAGIQLPGDEQPDPEKLTADLTAARASERQTAVELAVYRTAGKHQGDPDALLDSRGFLTKVADLDPKADDFASKVDAAIRDAVKDNPKLKAGRAPGASGADHAGGSGEGTQRTPKPLTEAVASHYGT